MSGSKDRVGQIDVELAEIEARLAELRGLAGRLERFELVPSDQVLLLDLVSDLIEEKLAAEGEEEGAIEESSAVVRAHRSGPEGETRRGPFGVRAWWTRR